MTATQTMRLSALPPSMARGIAREPRILRSSPARLRAMHAICIAKRDRSPEHFISLVMDRTRNRMGRAA